MVDVSVVVCTYNRAESLRDTIESLISQKASDCSYEIIVVDNNSKDQTREVVESFKDQDVGANLCVRPRQHTGQTHGSAPTMMVPIRYLFEPRQGLSYARNRGIREARGQVVAFTDDDVIVNSEWVSSILRCFQETQAAAVAGKIDRLWNCDRPSWLADEITGPLIFQDLGPLRKRWDLKNRHMIGANMAFDRKVFEQFGYFREELGRRGELLIGGEDREMFQRLFQTDCSIYYEPKALVAHKVEKERLTQEYMRRWFSHIGETLGHQMNGKWHHHVVIAPIWVWKQTLGSLTRFLVNRMKRKVNEAELFASELWVRHQFAILKERFTHWLPFRMGKGWCVFK